MIIIIIVSVAVALRGAIWTMLLCSSKQKWFIFSRDSGATVQFVCSAEKNKNDENNV